MIKTVSKMMETFFIGTQSASIAVPHLFYVPFSYGDFFLPVQWDVNFLPSE